MTYLTSKGAKLSFPVGFVRPDLANKETKFLPSDKLDKEQRFKEPQLFC